MNAPTTSACLEDLLAHAGWVRSLVRELVRDPDRRADVEQETWLAALTRLPSGLRDPKGWLRAVALNVLRQEARGVARRERRERTAARAEALPSTAELVGQADLERRVVRAVLELAEPDRSTLLLHYFRGLSCAEIARGEGLPASTVRNRLQRGLAELRERFDRELGGAVERRRILCAWLALPVARTTSRLSVPLVRGFGLALLLLAIGTIGARWWPDKTLPAPLAAAEARGPSPATDLASALAAGRAADSGAERAPLEPAGALPPVGPAGRVLDEISHPIPDALVTVTGAARFETEPVSLGIALRTDSAGRFFLPPELGLRSGLELIAEKPGYVPERAELVRDETVLTLRSAVTVEGLVVAEETDEPLAGVRITFHDYDWVDGAVRPTVTDAAGRFSIARIPPGLVHLRLARPGDAFQARRAFLAGPGKHEVRIPLPAGAQLTGRVVDGETGAGLAGAPVVVDFCEVARSSADGSFALGGLERGERHDVEARLPGHCASVRSLEVGDALEGPVLLPLFRECVVQGSVQDETGAPVPFAGIELHASEPPAGLVQPASLPGGVRLGSIFAQAHATHADELGRFRLDQLEPWRSFELVAVHPAHGRRALGGRIDFFAPGSHAAATVVFPPATARLEGRVLVNGAPARAHISWSAAASAGETEANELGAYRIEAIEPGPIHFRVEVEERGLELEEDLALAAETPGRHDFELRAAQVALAGFVRRPDGAPVADQIVLAFSPTRTGLASRGKSDASGAFRLWVTAASGEALTVRARSGIVWASLFPVPAGAEGVELVLPETGQVEVRVLVPPGAPEPTELEVAWRDETSPGFVELPRFALVPIGNGLWRIEVPAGRIDLEIRAPRGAWDPVRLADVRVDPRATSTPLVVSFEEHAR